MKRSLNHDEPAANSKISKSNTTNIYDAIIKIFKMIPSYGSNKSACCIYLHQLYCIVENKALVDKEIMNLKNSNVIRLIHSPTCSSSLIIVMVDDYLNYIDETKLSMDHHGQICFDKFKLWIKSCSKTSIFHDHLIEGKLSDDDCINNKIDASLHKDDIDLLLQYKYLIPRRDTEAKDLYWISHPMVYIYIYIYMYLMYLIKKYLFYYNYRYQNLQC